MRPLEVALLGAIATAAVWRVFPGSVASPWRVRLSILIGAMALCHLVIEGWRWQIIPGYATAAGVVALELSPWSRLGTGVGWNILLASLVLVLVGCAFAVGYVVPVFALPVPNGPYTVGTFTRHLIDNKRMESHAQGSSLHRELMIQVWYPAENVPGSRAWYRDPKMNSFKSSHLRLVKTHSFWTLPVAQLPAKFPVLLFSPSSGGNRNQNTFEVEELVSRGYVVVGVDHPYSCSRVVFPDGRIIHSLPNAWVDLSSPANMRASTPHVEAMIEDHVADSSFVLDELERWNEAASEPLRGRLDMNRVGMFGHSFGGAAAAEACVKEPRIKGGINMDGWMFGEAKRSGIPKPFFFMNEDEDQNPTLTPATANDPGAQAIVEGSLAHFASIRASLQRFGGYNLTIRHAGHADYSDIALFTRIPHFGGDAVADPRRVHKIVNDFTLAFFNRVLNGQSERILEKGEFPGELRYQAYPAPVQPLH